MSGEISTMNQESFDYFSKEYYPLFLEEEQRGEKSQNSFEGDRQILPILLGNKERLLKIPSYHLRQKAIEHWTKEKDHSTFRIYCVAAFVIFGCIAPPLWMFSPLPIFCFGVPAWMRRSKASKQICHWEMENGDYQERINEQRKTGKEKGITYLLEKDRAFEKEHPGYMKKGPFFYRNAFDQKELQGLYANMQMEQMEKGENLLKEGSPRESADYLKKELLAFESQTKLDLAAYIGKQTFFSFLEKECDWLRSQIELGEEKCRLKKDIGKFCFPATHYTEEIHPSIKARVRDLYRAYREEVNHSYDEMVTKYLLPYFLTLQKAHLQKPKAFENSSMLSNSILSDAFSQLRPFPFLHSLSVCLDLIKPPNYLLDPVFSLYPMIVKKEIYKEEDRLFPFSGEAGSSFSSNVEEGGAGDGAEPPAGEIDEEEDRFSPFSREGDSTFSSNVEEGVAGDGAGLPAGEIDEEEDRFSPFSREGDSTFSSSVEEEGAFASPTKSPAKKEENEKSADSAKEVFVSSNQNTGDEVEPPTGEIYDGAA